MKEVCNESKTFMKLRAFSNIFVYIFIYKSWDRADTKSTVFGDPQFLAYTIVRPNYNIYIYIYRERER